MIKVNWLTGLPDRIILRCIQTPAASRPESAAAGRSPGRAGRSAQPSGRDLVLLEHRIIDTLHYISPASISLADLDNESILLTNGMTKSLS